LLTTLIDLVFWFGACWEFNVNYCTDCSSLLITAPFAFALLRACEEADVAGFTFDPDLEFPRRTGFSNSAILEDEVELFPSICVV
jgi:hypothetical protein